MIRHDGRRPDELRRIQITKGISRYAEGSVLIEAGHTRVLCAASLDLNFPKWRQGSGEGWVTAEYGMLPRSTHDRVSREKSFSGGRSQEISRLIGRSFRSGVDLRGLGERQIIVDCDVLQADGGTRTMAITGGYIALVLALQELVVQGELKQLPLKSLISAVSVGLVHSSPLLDLSYEEDSEAEVDMNFVFDSDDRHIEIQGTAERRPFSQTEMATLTGVALQGCRQLKAIQQQILDPILPSHLRSRST